jgi:hypothetical protein
LFLTYSKIWKQNKDSGKPAAIDFNFSTEYDSRTLDIAVRRVPQEYWTSHRSSTYYKASYSTLYEEI